jgi:mannose-6-phosphate isomerase-like protein (cupin superfamily)
MEKFKLKEMVRGWFVGDFEPTAFRTKDFEVGYHTYKEGQQWDKHYHKLTTEINYIIRGKMKINDELLEEGDVFIIYPDEIVEPIYLTDCELIITRNGSFKNDKYVIQ